MTHKGGMKEPLAFGLLLGSLGAMFGFFWDFLMLGDSIMSRWPGLIGEFNLGFILGGCAVFRALATNSRLVYRDGLLLIGTSLLLVWMLSDLHLARHEGIILFAGLIGYIALLFIAKNGRSFDESEMPTGLATWWDVPMLLIGISGVVGGGHLLVHSASYLAKAMGISDWVIAVTIVAAGTSAPEFATSLMAAAKGRAGISLGNLIGSDLFNLLGVLGIAGIIRPLAVSSQSLPSVYMLVGMCLLTVLFLRTGWTLRRWEGAVLIMIGLIRWTLDFLARGV